ncbi:hypothetical protein FDP41_004482 [Naegleria fowleri]|uniref:protein-tyrosine-phosphatase n=1 Tax=Naegleria fowleri TaxID=5763 RepID=A0A6A5BFG2_NAEFO|nr:uncharacterized protein FDP41_004482 [Naegleria fowleri]KAF0976583.1 hypothetical protein FDP41_004482 [Naegleria fowleri]CAG4709960.1 unnamed protein product [Naegleria fowleri]
MSASSFQSSMPSTIIDGMIYLGSFAHARNKSCFEQLNIGCVVNCARELNNHFENQVISEQIGPVRYYHLELNDDTLFDIFSHFDLAFEFVNKFLESQQETKASVLFHCASGCSRSASITIAFLMKKNHWDFKTAYQYVKEKRSKIQPNEGFVECENKPFPNLDHPSIDISQYHKL